MSPGQSRPTIKSLSSAELTDEKLEEIADFFRLVFNNYWSEYVVCIPCDAKLDDGMRKSALEVYGTNEGPVPLDVLDNADELPDCPKCSKEMQLFHDRETVLKSTRRKLDKDGHVSLLRNETSGALEGFTFGYGCTLEEAFFNEWRNPYHYAAHPPREYDRSFDVLERRLNDTFPEAHFQKDTTVFCWNCIATLPSARLRGIRNTAALIEALFQRPNVLGGGEYVIGEAETGSTAHAIFKMLGSVDVPGVIGEANTIGAARPSSIPRDFEQFFRDAIRESLRARRKARH